MAAMNKTRKDLFYFMGDGENLEDGKIVLVVALAYYTIVLLLGLPGNAIIIQAYAWKKRKTSTDVLIMAQAIVDFIACIFSPALTKLITLSMCLPPILAATEDATSGISLLLTTIISVDRYLVICRPLRRRMSVRSSVLLVMIEVVIILSIFSTPAFCTKVDITIINGQRRCIFSTPFIIHFSITLTYGMLYITSFLSCTLLYAFIYAFLRKRAKIHADLVGNGLPVATIDSNNDSIGSSDAKVRMHLRTLCGTQNAVSDPSSMKIKSETLQGPLPSELGGCSSNAHDLRIPHERNELSFHLGSSYTEQTRESGSALRLTKSLKKSLPASQKTSRIQSRSRNQPTIQKNKKIYDFGRKTTCMLLVISVYLFVTWSPTIVMFSFCPQILERNTGIPGFPLVHNILRAFRLTNHFVNFFVYYSVSNSFRRDVRESFKKSFGRK